MNTASYSRITFREAIQWLTINGDNKGVFGHYRGIKFDNPSHRRDAEAILSALVKLRQRDLNRITNQAHAKMLNELEANIVDFCSHALACARSDIKHKLNKDVYQKFRNLVQVIKEAKPVFYMYGLTTQVKISDLSKAGLLSEGLPCAEGLLKLRNKNFNIKAIDPSRSIFEQLMTNQLIELQCTWSNSVKQLTRGQRLEFSMENEPSLVRIEVKVGPHVYAELLQAVNLTDSEVQAYVKSYQEKLDAHVEASRSKNKPIYSATAILKYLVLQEEQDIRNKLHQSATELAFKTLVEDPNSLKDKIMGLSSEAKKQLLKLVDANLFGK